MSDPNEEGAPRGVEEALTLMRQAIEQMAQQQAETRTLLLQQQGQLSGRIDQLQTSHAQVLQQVQALQQPGHVQPAFTPVQSEREIVRSLASLLDSSRRRAGYSSAAPSVQGPAQVKQEHAAGGGEAQYCEEESTSEENAPQQPAAYPALTQEIQRILEDLPPASDIPKADRQRGGHRARDPYQDPIPVRHPFYDPSRSGLTGVIIGDQVPFDQVLKEFDVKSVYLWLREIERYEHTYPVTVNRVNFIREDILDTISASPEVGIELNTENHMWSPYELKIAITRYFGTFRYSPRVLCEVAAKVTPYPRVARLEDNSTDARKALEQLNQLPVYCQRLRRFAEFISEYHLLPAGWPTENNTRLRYAHRLNEVLEVTMYNSAPLALSQITDDLYKERKSNILTLLSRLPFIARQKIQELAHVDEVQERMNMMPKRPEAARMKGEAAAGGGPRQWMRGVPTSPAARDANFVSSKSPAARSNLNYLGEADSEDAEEDNGATWSDTVSAEKPPQAAGNTEVEDVNALQASTEAATDRSKQICHSHLFHPQGCIHVQRGTQCPFSHDASVGVAELSKVLDKLKLASRG